MTEKLRLDIQVLLPEIDTDADGCVDRLVSELEGRPGIQAVHLRKGALLETSLPLAAREPA